MEEEESMEEALALEATMVGEAPCLEVVVAQDMVPVHLLVGKVFIVRCPPLGIPSVLSMKGIALVLWGQGLGTFLILAELGLALDIGAASGRRNISDAFQVVEDLNGLVLRMGLGIGLMEGGLLAGGGMLVCLGM